MRIRQFENKLYIIQNKIYLSGRDLLFVYICILYWRSKCQEGEDWNPINWFNSTTFLCLTQDTTLISNTICCGLFTSTGLTVWTSHVPMRIYEVIHHWFVYLSERQMSYWNYRTIIQSNLPM